MISLEKSYEKFIFLLHEQLSALMTNLTFSFIPYISEKQSFILYKRAHRKSGTAKNTHYSGKSMLLLTKVSHMCGHKVLATLQPVNST